MNEISEPKKLWKMEKKEAIQNIVILLAVVSAIVGSSFFVSIEKLGELVGRIGIFGPLLLIALKASTIVFAPLSGSPLYPLAGALFPPWLGFSYIVLGDMLGAVISFYISRRYGRRVVERFLSKSNTVFLDAALSYIATLKGFLIARIVFSPLPEVASYAAGLTALPFVPFFVIHSAVGLVPAAILVWFGAVLGEAQGPLGLVAVLLGGSVIAGLGVFVFFKFIQPRALRAAAETEKTS